MAEQKELRLTDQEIGEVLNRGGNIEEAQKAKEQAYIKSHPTAEYTKGEWTVKKAPINHLVVVDADIMGETDNGVVAETYSCFTGTSKANAQLISASPDLYEALKLSFRDLCENGRITEPIETVIKQALAKAEGKEQAYIKSHPTVEYTKGEWRRGSMEDKPFARSILSIFSEDGRRITDRDLIGIGSMLTPR